MPLVCYRYFTSVIGIEIVTTDPLLVDLRRQLLVQNVSVIVADFVCLNDKWHP